MSDDIAIKVENLIKTYRLYSNRLDRVKESLHLLGRKFHHDFYALNDVSFEIKKGETVGIIGKNGSGKSTLLKIITGVLTPSSGLVTVNGKISALLELGAGFNPELSGLENIYFNGTLMGYMREEMENRLDDILSFADIGEFVNQPVKMYSSGMFVRLAFAVAINVDPDILIVDEALSVGDIKFQRKCFSKIEQFHAANKTIIFVTHGLEAINLLCDSALILDNGKIIESGEPKKITKIFYKLMLEHNYVDTDNEEALDKAISANLDSSVTVKSADKIVRSLLCNYDIISKIKNDKLLEWNGVKKAEIIGCGILDCNLQETAILESGNKYTVYSIVLTYIDLDKIHVGYQIRNAKGLLLFAVNSEVQRVALHAQKKGDIIEGRVDLTMWLAPGDYFLSFRAATRYEDFDELADQIHFVVIGDCQLVSASIVNLEPKVTVKEIKNHDLTF